MISLEGLTMNISARTHAILVVDYENLLLETSYRNATDVDEIINELFQDAQHQFGVETCVLIGDWSLMQPPKLLSANLKYITWTTQEKGKNGTAHELFRVEENAEVYILVLGKANSLILDQLLRDEKKVVLWILSNPTFEQLQMCLGWKKIKLKPKKLNGWSRKINLHAIALLIYLLSQDRVHLSVDLTDLVASARGLVKINHQAEYWIYVAYLEHLLYMQKEKGSIRVILNPSHTLARETDTILTRLVSVFNSLISNSRSIPFSVMEKGMKTSKIFQKNEAYRKSWIELMIDLDFFSSTRHKFDQNNHLTTYISPGAHFPSQISLEDARELQLMRLVIFIDNIIKRKGYKWISIANALRVLTRSGTLIEARKSIDVSRSKNLVRIEKITNIRPGGFPVSTITLNYYDQFVFNTLLRRDKAIYLLDDLLAQRPSGVSKNVMIKTLLDSGRFNEREADFWVSTLIEESILRKVTFIQEYPLTLYHLKLDDPILKTALNQS